MQAVCAGASDKCEQSREIRPGRTSGLVLDQKADPESAKCWQMQARRDGERSNLETLGLEATLRYHKLHSPAVGRRPLPANQPTKLPIATVIGMKGCTVQMAWRVMLDREQSLD